MTAKRLLEINGDFRGSPLIDTARRLHEVFSRAGVDYVIVGGLAVARSGAVRTTQDVDVLTNRAGWPKIKREAAHAFDFGVEQATDRENGVTVDFLFAGDDWNLPFTLPPPARVSEMDHELGARFMDLGHLLELKCAVYLSKKAIDGMEIAAKDLADVVALMQANRQRIDEPLLSCMHPGVRDELSRIWSKVRSRLPPPAAKG